MKEVAAFLQHCKPFYLATMDGDKTQVRPFGALCEVDDQLMTVFRFINGQGTIYSFTAEPVTYSV